MIKKTPKTATPDEIVKVVTLREVGHSILSIAQELGISPRSVQRHLSTHGTRKGSVKPALIAAARTELLNRIVNDDVIREEAARLVADDLAHARHLRSLLAGASEHLTATSLKDAILVMRGAAAYSVAIKNTSDMLRHALQIDRTTDDVGELPELVISELTADQVLELRSRQAAEGAMH